MKGAIENRDISRFIIECAQRKVIAPNQILPVAEVVSVANLGIAFEETAKKLLSWCFNPWAEFKPSEVVVLVLAPEATRAIWPEEDYRLTVYEDSQRKMSESLPFTRSLVDWLAGKDVLITSWGNCKFIEADAVIVIETPKEKDNFFGKHLARSRARKMLTVFQVGA